MATLTESPRHPSEGQKVGLARHHPLRNITAAEIRKASAIGLRCLRERENDQTLEVRFKNVSLQEPAKALLLPYLNAEASGVPVRERPYIPRCVELVYAFNHERNFGQLIVDLDTSTEVRFRPAMKGQHSSMDR